jgi:hypothetical protein
MDRRDFLFDLTPKVTEYPGARMRALRMDA